MELHGWRSRHSFVKSPKDIRTMKLLGCVTEQAVCVVVSEVDLGSPPRKLPKPSLCSVCSLLQRWTVGSSHLCHHTHGWDVRLHSCAHVRGQMLTCSSLTEIITLGGPGNLQQKSWQAFRSVCVCPALFQLVLVEDSIQAKGRSPVSTQGSCVTPCPSAQLPWD